MSVARHAVIQRLPARQGDFVRAYRCRNERHLRETSS